MGEDRSSFEPSLPAEKANEAKSKASRLGHRLGKWDWKNGNWYSKCQNKGCHATATMNRQGDCSGNIFRAHCQANVR